MTTQDHDIVFDPKSGISEEEQREILAKINSISEKNRMSLSAGAGGDSDEDKKKGGKPRFKAKKKGSFFPIMVNVAAALILIIGSIILVTLHGKTDSEVREGTNTYNSAERVLIEQIKKETYSRINEIRRETTFRLEEKENEISMISLKLEEIDAELQELYSSNLEHTAEQMEAERRLKALQEDYRAMLTFLQNEKSEILENARIKEAELQALLDSKTRELAFITEQSIDVLDAAYNEMERLNREQARSTAVEAEIGAFFTNLNGQINNNQLDDATVTIQSIRDFMDTPSFQAIRSLQTRKNLYVQAIDLFETMIEMKKNPLNAKPAETDITAEKILADMQLNITRLEQDVIERDKTITALSSEGTGTAALIMEKDSQISSLRSDLTAQTQTAETTQRALNTVRAENTVQKDSLDKIIEIISGKDIDNMSFNEIRDNVARIQGALETLNKE